MAIESPRSPPAEAGTLVDGVAVRRRPKIYYGYYLVGAAFIAQMISAGTQTYVSGVFLVPMTEDLSWTRSEFITGQTVGRFLTAFIGLFLGGLVDRGYARRLLCQERDEVEQRLAAARTSWGRRRASRDLDRVDAGLAYLDRVGFTIVA